MAALGFFTVGYARQGTAVLARAGLCPAADCSGRMPLARSTICRATDSERFDRELPVASRRSYRGNPFPYTIVRDTKTLCEGIRVPE